MDNIIRDEIVSEFAIDVLYRDYSGWTLEKEDWLNDIFVIYRLKNKDNTVMAEVKGNVVEKFSIVTEFKYV